MDKIASKHGELRFYIANIKLSLPKWWDYLFPSLIQKQKEILCSVLTTIPEYNTSLGTLFSMANIIIFGLIILLYSPLIFMIFFIGVVWIWNFMKRRAKIDNKMFHYQKSLFLGIVSIRICIYLCSVKRIVLRNLCRLQRNIHVRYCWKQPVKLFFGRVLRLHLCVKFLSCRVSD